MSDLDLLLAERRFNTRLGISERVVSRTFGEDGDWSMAFDLASSPLDDDELETIAPDDRQGWGFSEVLQDLLSRESAQVAVDDLKQMQQNLIDLGYADDDRSVDGNWDPSWNSAFGRFERDNYEQVRSGNSYLAATVTQGLNTLGYVLPSSVMQGVIGAAKGIAAQAGETAERSGLAGGAAGGAVIGASIGSVLPGAGTGAGALIGGAVGAIAGFAADFFGEDEAEGDQTVSQRFWDALTPFNGNEWGEPKNFFEDLGFVMTASSLIRGGGMALGAAAKGTSSIATATAYGTPLRDALLMKQGLEAPGWFARISGAAIKPISSGAAKTWVNYAKNSGLLAQSSRPLLKMGNDVFTGLATANVGARLSAGMGSGNDDPTTKHIENLSTIEQGIISAPSGPTVNLPGLGKVNLLDDTLGWLVFSNRFLPFEKGAVGEAAQVALTKPFKEMFSLHAGRAAKDYIESGVALKPYIDASQQPGMSIGDAREAVKKALGPDIGTQIQTDLYLRLDYGIKRRAGEKVARIREEGAPDTEKIFNDAVTKELSALRTAMDEGNTNYVNEILALSHLRGMEHSTRYGTMDFAAYLKNLEGKGSPLERMEQLRTAHDDIRNINSLIQDGSMAVSVPGFASVKAAFKGTRHTNFEKAEALKARKTLQKEVDKLSKTLARTKPKDREAVQERINKLKADLDAIEVPAGETVKPDAPFMVTIARKYEAPDAAAVAAGAVNPGHHGYTTYQEHLSLADRYDQLRQELTSSFEASLKSPDAMGQYVAKQQEWDDFVQDLEWRGLLDGSGVEAAALKNADPKSFVSKRIRERAKYAGKDVELGDPTIAQRFDEMGYKPIAVRKNVLLYDEMSKVKDTINASGIGDYTKRAAFFETLGMSPFKFTDRSLFQMRLAHENAELETVMQKHGIKQTGSQAMRKLQDRLVELNHGKGGSQNKLVGPTVIEVPGKGNIVKDSHLYKVDTRELSVDDIADALHLDDLTDNPYEVAQDVYAALKRGAAMGGETNFRNPIGAARDIGRALRVNGLPGFSDWMRTFHYGAGTSMVAGAAVGGTLGYYDNGWQGAAIGAGLGAAGGAGFNALLKHKFPKGTYGYLPDKLHRLNMALRYSFSLAFDAGRYMEQNTLGVAHGLPVIMNPKAYITRHYGPEAWDDAIDLLDRVNGTKGLMRIVDDTDRRQFQRGILGFSPRYHEAAQAYVLHRVQGKSLKEIEHIVSSIGRYGVGRTAAEKSINFVFFPFSFQKKLLTTLGEAVLQQPARALLLHEGLRVYDESGANEKFSAWVEENLPLANQLARLNNLSYGISMGRFLLEGTKDHRSGAGQAAQILTSIFAPSGAATPLAQAAGKSMDAAVNFFTPLAITGEEMYGADDILSSYVPAIKDLFGEQGIVGSFSEQYTAIREGAAPYAQLQDYLDEKRAFKQDLEPIAMALGYSSVDGFLSSDAGMGFRAQYDALVTELNEKYPSGLRLTSQFENDTAINKQALMDMANKVDRSEAEDAILELVQLENSYSLIKEVTGVDIPATSAMRNRAALYANNDRFRVLWDRFMADSYGPLTFAKVA